MTKQSLRKMHEESVTYLQELAEIKVMAIHACNEVTDYNAKADRWNKKDMLLSQKTQRRELAKADRLTLGLHISIAH